MDSGGSEIDHPPLLDHDGQGVGRQGHRGSRGRPTGSQGVRVWTYRVPRGQGEAPCRLPGEGVDLQDPKESTGRFDGSTDDVEGISAYI